jgi:hypothetical protein
MRLRSSCGKFLPGPSPIERFVKKLAFDPFTGCVMWIGGTTAGHGHNMRYGAFWYEGRRWFAHRWAAKHIHGLDIDGLQVDHCCPHGPATLCVEHLRGETLEANRALQIERGPSVPQSSIQKQYWLLVERGYEPYTPPERDEGDVPFYGPPAWLRPYLMKEYGNGCPF